LSPRVSLDVSTVKAEGLLQQRGPGGDDVVGSLTGRPGKPLLQALDAVGVGSCHLS
jgi:hypothetical protein